MIPVATRYTPLDWFWVVGEDETLAWSSALSDYVSEWSSERVTKIATEEELSAVLRGLGLKVPKPNADDVRAECQRRIILVSGATSTMSCMIKQLNALMRMGKLLRIVAEGGALTPEQQSEAAALTDLSNAIEHLRAKSNTMESNPPFNFTDDSRWA